MCTCAAPRVLLERWVYFRVVSGRLNYCSALCTCCARALQKHPSRHPRAQQPPLGRDYPLRLLGAHLDAPALLYVDPTQSSKIGKVRGLQWHNLPRESKGSREKKIDQGGRGRTRRGEGLMGTTAYGGKGEGSKWRSANWRLELQNMAFLAAEQTHRDQNTLRCHTTILKTEGNIFKHSQESGRPIPPCTS